MSETTTIRISTDLKDRLDEYAYDNLPRSEARSASYREILVAVLDQAKVSDDE